VSILAATTFLSTLTVTPFARKARWTRTVVPRLTAKDGRSGLAWGGTVRLLAEGLGVELDEIREMHERRPAVRPIRIGAHTVEPGTMGAMRFEVQGIVKGRPAVVVEHVAHDEGHPPHVVPDCARAGVEIGGASTKAFSAQLVAVTLLALKLGLARGFADPVLVRQMVKGLIDLPDLISVVLQQSDAVRRVAGRAKIEISGGVTLDRMEELARTGADYVSVGALTHSAPAADISFELEPERKEEV